MAEAEENTERLFGASHVKYAMAELTKSDRGDEVDTAKFSDLFIGRHVRGTINSLAVIFVKHFFPLTNKNIIFLLFY